MKNQKEAFRWIVDILNKHNVKFVVSGGLAARAYGSPRQLNDIDLDIEEFGFSKIIEDVKKYVISGPEEHKSRAFMNKLLKLDYDKVIIDLAEVGGSKIFNNKTQKWEIDNTNLSRNEIRNVFGIMVPVMIRDDVITYKSKSPRPEDLIDIEALRKIYEKSD
ncbi:MAG: hypothetical protein AAB513_00570 [Patescibacteria group bacterium]